MSTIYRGFLLLLLCLLSLRAGAEEGAYDSSETRFVPDSILDYLFDSASLHSQDVKSYKADMYLKGMLQVHKQNRLIRFIPSKLRIEKGVDKYFHESLSELHYTAPAIYDRKVRGVASTFPNSEGQVFDIMDYMKFNIYEPSILGDKLLSPLNRTSKVHYYYQLDSVHSHFGGDWYKINVIPRYKSTQLLYATYWVSSEDWTIRYADLRGRYDLIRFHISVQMGEAADTRVLPVLFNMDLHFKFLKNHVEMDYTGWLKYKEVKMREPGEVIEHKRKKTNYNLSTSYTLTCDTSKLVAGRDSFNRLRPIPLSSLEDSLYVRAAYRDSLRKADTLKVVPKTKFKKSMLYLGQLGDALISSYDVDLSKFGSLTCSPLVNPLLISYSHRKGLSYRQEFKYNQLFPNGHLLRITPQIGYNFTKKEFYAQADLRYVYNPRKRGAIELRGGNDNRIYSSVVLDQLKQQPDSTFSFDGLELDYFKDIYFDISHSIELVNGLNLNTGIAMHWRYTESSPEVETRVRSKYNSFAPRIRVEWTPGMFYYLNGNRKINVGSRYPTFTADYERGIRLLKNSGEYERFEFSASQVINLRNVRSIAYHVGAGFFTNQEDMYFVDYADFANHNLPQGWDDEIGGSFQMLDGRWYNASRHYIRGNFTYEAPFIFLYPVTRLLSFIQKERLYAGVLFMPHLNPYLEFGYGFATTVFDVGVFIGNEKGKFTSVGCKFTFELFNK